MPLSREEEERIARLAVNESMRNMMRNILEAKSPRERQQWLDQLEAAVGASPGRPSPLAQPSPTRCDRCGRRLSGRYYSLKKPGGGTAELCLRCTRKVRLRLRMLAAKPNRKAQELAQSAIRDLQEAAALDPKSEQVRTNLKNIRPLLAAAGGSPLAYALVWAPLWALSRVFGSWGNAALAAAAVALLWGLYRTPALGSRLVDPVLRHLDWLAFAAVALIWLIGLIGRPRRRR